MYAKLTIFQTTEHCFLHLAQYCPSWRNSAVCSCTKLSYNYLFIWHQQSNMKVFTSEVFFGEIEVIFCTMMLQYFGKSRSTTEENFDFTLLLIMYTLEYLELGNIYIYVSAQCITHWNNLTFRPYSALSISIYQMEVIFKSDLLLFSPYSS